MKTRCNITIGIEILERVKAEANGRGVTLSAVVQQALTWWLVLSKLRSNGTRLFIEEKGERKELILS